MVGGMSVPPTSPHIESTELKMTISLNSIKNNIEAERNGTYIEVPDWPGVSLGVRSLEIPAFKIAVDQLVQRYARKYKGKAAPPDVRDADHGRLLAKHILFGWKGFEQEYTEASAEDLLISPEGRDFAKQVVWAATQVAETEIEFVDEAVKN